MPDFPEHQLLGGEATESRYGFESQTGVPLKGGEAIIPLLGVLEDKKYFFLGTGFFITYFGVFVTAKHVLEKVIENNHAVATWQLIPPNQWLIRPVGLHTIKTHPDCDLAIGVAGAAVDPQTRERLIQPRLPLTTRVQNVEDLVTTYAYPNTIFEASDHSQIFSFTPSFYEGKIMEHLPGGRDQVMLPGPCYRTSVMIHHGASGGPVVEEDGWVFGVNSTGFNGTNESFISQIDGILSLTIKVKGDHRVEELSVKQLADEGIVEVYS